MDELAENRRRTKVVTDALEALPGGPGAVAHLADHLAVIHAEHLAVRTTALNAAATLTAGMSAAEVQTDHDSRSHDPLAPVSNVIALAGEFEAWLARPQPNDEDLDDLCDALDCDANDDGKTTC